VNKRENLYIYILSAATFWHSEVLALCAKACRNLEVEKRRRFYLIARFNGSVLDSIKDLSAS